MDNLEEITKAVARLVGERLGSKDPELLEVVVNEVVSVMAGAREVPPPSTPAPKRTEAVDNGDGTMTTPLGSVVGIPAADGALAACASCAQQSRSQSGNRAVVTTTGVNKKGALALIAAQVARTGGDIQDVSQTIIADYFTMIMTVDLSALTVPFAEFKEQLIGVAGENGIHAVVLHENVLHALQRV